MMTVVMAVTVMMVMFMPVRMMMIVVMMVIRHPDNLTVCAEANKRVT